ncbi:AraC family transcriptional regulator [Caulobacter sp. KR2-114]|uniref:AraC family transcriptional regulator n=1 Tax=Caulobacter sp. KR2-114 TaxID=3400912 RepID=UPI003C09D29E
MQDPLSQIVRLLQPVSPQAHAVDGAGPWGVRREEVGRPYFCVVLQGACRLAVDGEAPVILQAGDFALVPSADGFLLSSPDATPDTLDETAIELPTGECRIGRIDGSPDARLLTGYCAFASPDADILLSLLPRLAHARGETRLAMLTHLVSEELGVQRPGRDAVLERLLEVLFIEALRSSACVSTAPNLLQGLADERLAQALRRIHEAPSHRWTVAELAREAALSRSAFFERFHRVVGVAPMAYLAAWRMATAKTLLRDRSRSLGEIAEQLGYRSANSFSIAFTRRFGAPPTRYVS